MSKGAFHFSFCGTRRTRPARAAFTLLELLIAVSIFAIVLASINAVFFAALRLRNRTAASLDKLLPVEQALTIIRRDLANIVIPGTNLAGPLQTTPGTNAMANSAGPVFFTATGALDDVNPYADIQKISYTLLPSTNRYQGMDLVRLVSRNLLAPTPETPIPQWLLSGVSAFNVLFYDGGQWRDYWDSTTELTKLPLGIKVQIQRAPEIDPGTGLASIPSLIELVVPMVTDGGTNDTSGASTQTTQ
jgi:general secretion pathway protein J